MKECVIEMFKYLFKLVLLQIPLFIGVHDVSVLWYEDEQTTNSRSILKRVMLLLVEMNAEKLFFLHLQNKRPS